MEVIVRFQFSNGECFENIALEQNCYERERNFEDFLKRRIRSYTGYLSAIKSIIPECRRLGIINNTINIFSITNIEILENLCMELKTGKLISLNEKTNGAQHTSIRSQYIPFLISSERYEKPDPQIQIYSLAEKAFDTYQANLFPYNHHTAEDLKILIQRGAKIKTLKTLQQAKDFFVLKNSKSITIASNNSTVVLSKEHFLKYYQSGICNYYDSYAIPVFDEILQEANLTIKHYNAPMQTSPQVRTSSPSQPLNQILYGPPGTGKTFHTISKALEILEGESVDLNQPLSETQRKSLKEKFDSYIKEEQIFFVTFHQSYGYEEFVEGIQAKTSESGEIFYQVENGIFKEICQRAKIAKNKKFVLIIDEVNRGNVSKIFGELITLIEPSKRSGESEELSATLPYSKESFSVPKNLYIIGTMNTADRSITALDTALRRRFDFVEMMPNPLLLKENCEGVDLQKLLQALNERIEFLLDREKTIGHAFLLEAHTLMDLKNVFRKKIIPLLQEYFYEDYALIDAVLNQNKMIKIKTQTPQNLFPKSLLEELEEKTLYSIASERDLIWDNPSTYQNIYTKHNQGNE